jgi:hypothetical protein
MRHLSDLVNAMVTKLSNIPELMAVLAPEDPIVGYVDLNPIRNSVEKAIYQMQPGQVFVNWTDTNLDEGQMSRWSHSMEICVRSLPGASDMDLVDVIMEGVPQPGDGLIWLRCPILDGLLPTNVKKIERRTDSEYVDYLVIMTETAETGDWPNP